MPETSCYKARHYDFIGNLDADVPLSLRTSKILLLIFIRRLRSDWQAALSVEETDGEFRSQQLESGVLRGSRRATCPPECYEAIGGYAVLEYGGEDWHAQTSAKMKGWEARGISGTQDLPSSAHRRRRQPVTASSFAKAEWTIRSEAIRYLKP